MAYTAQPASEVSFLLAYYNLDLLSGRMFAHSMQWLLRILSRDARLHNNFASWRMKAPVLIVPVLSSGFIEKVLNARAQSNECK